MLRHRLVALLTLPAVALPLPVTALRAQEAVDLEVVQKIREEGLERSQLETLVRHLTEVIGPRLSGSPGMKKANEWTAQTFRDWGLANVVIEPWGEFGVGWQLEEFQGRILTPFVQPLQAQPLAWSGSTGGLVRGPAVFVSVSDSSELEEFRGKLAGTFVLTEPPQQVVPEFEHRDRRASLEALMEPPPERPAGPGPGGTPPTSAEIQARMAAMFARRALARAVVDLARTEGAHAILRISSRNDGVVRGGSGGSREPGATNMPQLALSREQYNQIYRNLEAGVPVELEAGVKTTFLEDDLRQYNTLAEIPGTDKADEYVIIGAHLDSWHMGSGATDNAAGSVVMMEAMRILQSLGVEPRRTIRIALWSGEEQGLLGSRAWVANHAELHDKISAYLNLDNGTGRIRGIWDQSNEEAIPIFEQLLRPFRDLGVVAVRHGNTGGTDHLAFNGAGIPGFNFIQDPIEYFINTHHTELDTFDHLVIEDLQQAAVVVASTAYHLAMREEMVPRKPSGEAVSRAF